MKITDSGRYDIYVDFAKMHIYKFPNIVFNENDLKTSKIRVYILSNEEVVNLTNIQVDIKIINSKFETSCEHVTEINLSEGYVEYEFRESDLVAGIGLFQIKIYNNTLVKITPKIRYKVIKSI